MNGIGSSFLVPTVVSFLQLIFIGKFIHIYLLSHHKKVVADFSVERQLLSVCRNELIITKTNL